MVQDENVSIDSELTPENQNRYGEYYDLNKEESTKAGTEVEDTNSDEVQSSGEEAETEVDTQIEPVKADEAEVKTTEDKANDAEPASKRKSGYQRSIDRLTRQRNQEKETVADLRRRLKAATEAQAEPVKKLTPDNFLTNEEYVEAVADQRAKATLAEYQKNFNIESLNQEITNVEHKVFADNWNEKVNESFPIEADKEAFNKMVTEVGDLGLPKDVHDYLDYSADGPKLYTVLALRPDVLSEIKSKSEYVRTKILSDIEKVINQAPVSSPETKPQTTNAPAPIGDVQSNSSGTVSYTHLTLPTNREV